MSDRKERKSGITEAERYYLVEQAIENRYSYREFLEQQETERKFSNETEIDRDAYHEDVDQVLHSPRYVICYNFEEISDFLPILEKKGYSLPEDVIPHERDHWNQLETEGFTPIIGFYFASVDLINFRRVLQIFTAPIDIPDGMSDSEYFEAMKRVLAAPENLSNSDRIMLGKDESNSS